MDFLHFSPPVEPPDEPKRPYLWMWVWFGFAAVMLPLVILTQARYQTVGLCFLAWCGGISFTLMQQERIKRKRKRWSDYHQGWNRSTRL